MKRFLVLASIVFLCVGCTRFPEPAVRYVAFGDSHAGGYPKHLPALLQVGDDEVAIESEGGEKLEDGLDRLESLIEMNIFPNAEYFMYSQGGNDIMAFIKKVDPLIFFSPNDPGYFFQHELDAELLSIQGKIQQAIRIAKAEGWSVLVMTYVPVQALIQCDPSPIGFLNPNMAGRVNDYQSLLNQAVATAASLEGAKVVRVDENSSIPFLGNYANCNHLNDNGNQIVAEMVLFELEN